MPAALDVDREQVRMLVLAVGVREAARRMDISENTVLAWANRGGWLNKTRVQSPELPRPASMVPRAIVAINPADALKNVLEENFGKSRLGLSKWLVESTQQLSKKRGDAALDFHAPAVSAASVLAKLCPPQAAVSMRISMFGSSADLLESLPEAHVTLEMDEQPGDPLDDY